MRLLESWHQDFFLLLYVDVSSSYTHTVHVPGWWVFCIAIFHIKHVSEATFYMSQFLIYKNGLLPASVLTISIKHNLEKNCVAAAFVPSWPVLVTSVICSCFWKSWQYQLTVMFVQGCYPGLRNSSGETRGNRAPTHKANDIELLPLMFCLPHCVCICVCVVRVGLSLR